MKLKISVSLDKKTVETIDRELVNERFRNRSHFIEYAIKKFLGEGA